jgi:hypothetical protein
VGFGEWEIKWRIAENAGMSSVFVVRMGLTMSVWWSA